MSFSDLSDRRGGHRSMASPVDAESEYARSSGQVTNNITQISANVSRIRNMVAALGTPKDTHEMRDKLHHGIDETKLLAQDTKRVIASLGRIEGGYQGVANAERKFEQRKISEDFSKVLKTFQEVVRDSVQREKEYVARAKTRAHRSISIDSEEERLGLLDADKSHELMQMENDIEFNQALIAEREAGIKEVESTVREVNEIFKDLAIIVSDQGQMIDDIESSVVQSHDRTSAATVELKKAAENERKARRTMCCLISILVVVADGEALQTPSERISPLPQLCSSSSSSPTRFEPPSCDVNWGPVDHFLSSSVPLNTWKTTNC